MQRDFNRLKHQALDLLVCGGGIYGAWVAYDAALRGLKVALVDKGDWAGGTSSASSKLIHGGLRYLETFDFKLVKKSLAERQMLLHAAPHRVWPLRFGVPVFKNNRLGSLRLKIGLALYDFLAGKLTRQQRHQQHAKHAFHDLFPYLATAELTAGFTYFDAQTDDARFVLEIIAGAYAAGAACLNYCAVTELLEHASEVQGAVLQDQLTGATISLQAKQVIDTTGRWSQAFRRSEDRLRLSKGIHLVMPNILKKHALLLTAKADGRVFFMIPWYGLTLLGTTDNNYDGDLEDIPITDQDISYLLAEANLVLDNVNWTEQNIIGKFSGVRVLQHSHRDNPSHISRDWVAYTARNGLISSIGGKLTSAREDAGILVDMACQRLCVSAQCQTSGRQFPWLTDTEYSSLQAAALHEASLLGIDKDCAAWLVKRHGNRTNKIFALCKDNPALTERIRPELPFILADLVFCTQNEMVVHLDDLLRRRLPLLILAKLTPAEIKRLAIITANALGWDDNQKDAEIKRCQQL